MDVRQWENQNLMGLKADINFVSLKNLVHLKSFKNC